MAELIVGKAAPDVSLLDDNGASTRLSSFRGRPAVITFYSDGTTVGCVTQNSEFSTLLPQFEALGATVIAIAPQNSEACAAFRKKHKLAHILLADDALKAVKAFGLWQQKKLWGHEYMGVIRSTVILDSKGKVAADIKATRIKGHAAKILETLRNLNL